MGRRRAPCCEKVGLKKGPWTAEEDMRLVAYINRYGHGNWRALPKQSGLLRCGKSCRLRWINYLRPDIKRGNFTQEEEETIIRLHGLLGNKWSKIASCLPGRTDNEIKNVWNTHLKKRVTPKGSNLSIAEPESEEILSKSTSSSSISSVSHCYQGKEVTTHEEQEQTMTKSESTPAVCNILQLENMHDPLDEIIQFPLNEPSMDIWDMLDESKETSSPSYSACSSHITCSNQVGDTGEDQTHPLFKSTSPFNGNDLEMAHVEVEQKPQGGVLEIPHVEPDMDFWDMLGEEFSSFSCDGGVFDGKETHQNVAVNEGESRGEADHGWVRSWLEDEPGFLMSVCTDHHQSLLKSSTIQPLFSCPTYDENIEEQVDPIKYFQIWSQSPPTFSL